MAEIINLRLARKRRARADQEQQASRNRAAFGQSKAERTLADARKALADDRLDTHRIRDEGE